MKVFEPKPLYIERIKKLLKDEEDVKEFFRTAQIPTKKSIRVDTLKISPSELKIRLEKYNWKITQPFEKYPEIMQVENILPGELGKAKEHLLGYYYIQEITSMMPVIVLNPKPDELVLDLCAAPGSKTTQIAIAMENKGTILANDISIERISILNSNLERMGVTNVIVTRHDGGELCKKLEKIRKKYFIMKNLEFDKILVDVPCSGEGNIRTSPITYLEWSEKLVESLSKKQKRLLKEAFKLLKKGGILVYSTCTYSPEENEEVIQDLLDNFPEAKILDFELPLKTREGITEWKDKKFSKELKKTKRIYHHDNDLEGFFICKIKKI